MESVKMTLSPKHLNFDEMWKLYKNVKSGLPETPKEKFVDEVIDILKGMSHDEFVSALTLLYGKNFAKGKNAAEFGLMFMKGIKTNKLFLFTEFIASTRK